MKFKLFIIGVMAIFVGIPQAGFAQNASNADEQVILAQIAAAIESLKEQIAALQTVVKPTAGILPSQTPASDLKTRVQPPIRDLRLGSRGSDVKQLQQFLNRAGLRISVSGYGSPNNETEYFGPLTRSKLCWLQESVLKIVEKNDPSCGKWGSKTRAAMRIGAGTTQSAQSGGQTGGTGGQVTPPPPPTQNQSFSMTFSFTISYKLSVFLPGISTSPPSFTINVTWDDDKNTWTFGGVVLSPGTIVPLANTGLFVTVDQNGHLILGATLSGGSSVPILDLDPELIANIDTAFSLGMGQNVFAAFGMEVTYKDGTKTFVGSDDTDGDGFPDTLVKIDTLSGGKVCVTDFISGKTACSDDSDLGVFCSTVQKAKNIAGKVGMTRVESDMKNLFELKCKKVDPEW